MRYFPTLLLVLFFSCSMMKKQGKADSVAVPFKGTSWQIISFPGFELEKTPRQVVISFSDSTDRFGGNTGCNGFGGSYHQDGKKLKLDQIMSTKMACRPGMQTENKLMKAMSETDSYQIEGKRLMLKSGEKIVAIFEQSKKD